MKSESWPERLSVVTACVSEKPKRWRSSVRKYGFADMTGWTNVHVDEDSAGVLAEIIGKGGGTLLLLDAEGRVLHSNIQPTTLWPVLRASFSTKEPSP